MTQDEMDHARLAYKLWVHVDPMNQTKDEHSR